MEPPRPLQIRASYQVRLLLTVLMAKVCQAQKVATDTGNRRGPACPQKEDGHRRKPGQIERLS